MDKKELRKFYSQKRDLLSENEIYNRSLNVCKIFFETDIYKNSEKIFTYINYKSEFNTTIIVKKAFEDNKRVFVPVMSGKAHEMFFVEIEDFSELSKNKFGILEPKLIFEKVLKSDNKTTIVVPALAYSRNGFRLGYGGGFYDKYLSENNSLCNIGLAFDFQITSDIVHNELDVPIDLIISENEFIKIKI